MVAPPREWKNYLYLNFIIITIYYCFYYFIVEIIFHKRYWINKGIQTVAPPVECKTRVYAGEGAEPPPQTSPPQTWTYTKICKTSWKLFKKPKYLNKDNTDNGFTSGN